MKQKQVLKFHTWNVFSRQKLFHSRKDSTNFQKFYMKLLKRKFQVKFLRGFSGEMFNSVRFTHEIKSSECFFDRFHTHTIFYKFSPNCFPLTWRKKKYLHFCCHSKLFSWKKKKKKFFSLGFTFKKTKFSWKCVYTRFHKRGNKIQSHMKEKKSPENSPDCFLLLGYTHKKVPLKTISSWKNLQKWNSWKLHTRLILMKNIFSQVHTWKHNN